MEANRDLYCKEPPKTQVQQSPKVTVTLRWRAGENSGCFLPSQRG